MHHMRPKKNWQQRLCHPAFSRSAKNYLDGQVIDQGDPDVLLLLRSNPVSRALGAGLLLALALAILLGLRMD